MSRLYVDRIEISDCRFQQWPGKPKSFCNLQSARRASQTVNQPVRRFQSNFIEFHRRIADALGGFSIDLQPVVMGCRDRQSADLPEFFENRARQSCAFARLGAAADFVHQD